MINRRQFLSFTSVPIAAAVVVPELVRTIILPPRGGWPDLSRYFTSNTAWYLKDHGQDFHTANMQYVKRERYGNRIMTGAEFRRILQPGLDAMFRKAYDEGLPDEDGKLVTFAEEWSAIYGTSG